MTAIEIAAEIAQIRSSRPAFGAFAAKRAERIAHLESMLANMPTPADDYDDADARRLCARFDASTAANRRADKWR